MKITDKTPFRNAGGKIDIFGRLSGSFKFGLSWYPSVQAQDVVVAALEKALGQNYCLLRNPTLPGTTIDIPMILLGPPGIYLLNVVHERGVFQAKGDDWGTIVADKFEVAKVNEIERTIKLGRVLRVFLERAGYGNLRAVEAILLSANPGMHIESIRPSVRIVLSDALDHFALSLNQAQPVFSMAQVNEFENVLLFGQNPAPTEPGVTLPIDPGSAETPSSFQPNPFMSMESGSNDTLASTPHNSEAFFDLQNAFSMEGEPPKPASNTQPQAETSLPVTETGTASQATSPTPVVKKTFLGMTTPQLLILGGMLLFWLLAIIFFVIYIKSNFS